MGRQRQEAKAAYPTGNPPDLLPAHLLTKANPPKGGDAKLRDYRPEIRNCGVFGPCQSGCQGLEPRAARHVFRNQKLNNLTSDKEKAMKENFGVIWTDEITEVEELEKKTAPSGSWDTSE